MFLSHSPPQHTEGPAPDHLLGCRTGAPGHFTSRGHPPFCFLAIPCHRVLMQEQRSNFWTRALENFNLMWLNTSGPHLLPFNSRKTYSANRALEAKAPTSRICFKQGPADLPLALSYKRWLAKCRTPQTVKFSAGHTPEVTKLQEFSKFSNPTQISGENYDLGHHLYRRNIGNLKGNRKKKRWN